MRQRRKVDLPEGKLRQGRRWNRGVLVLGCLLLVAAASIYAFALTQPGSGHADKLFPPAAPSDLAKSAPTEAVPPAHKVTPEESALSGKTEFGQFPPHTASERELEKMLHGKDEDIDLALANWLVVADLPQFGDLTRESYFKQLEALTEQVRQDMAAMQTGGRHRVNPDSPFVRCRDYVDAMHKLGFAYAEKFNDPNLTPAQLQAMYFDANNLFLAGLLRTRSGTCVSLPLIWIVIGQRLGLPVHLVTIGKHYFIRWEEPGLRMNIETTIPGKACVTPDDSVYLETEGMTRKQLAGNQLQNMTSREVLGSLFFTRSGYWDTKGPKCKTQQCLDLSCARHLCPDDPAITAEHQAMFNFYGIRPEYTSIDIQPKEPKRN